MTFEKLRTNRLNQWIIIHVRYLVGFAFFPSGLIKMTGERFTRISVDDPIGYFFEALYQSGFYWNFLGIAQVLAGLLLVTQRFATLGALLFLAILTNIWIITLSLSFGGTWVITSLMMIAVLILLIWDTHKLLPLISYNRTNPVKTYPDPDRAWVMAGLVYAFCFIALYFTGPTNTNAYSCRAAVFLGAMVLLAFVISNYKVYKKQKSMSKPLNTRTHN